MQNLDLWDKITELILFLEDAKQNLLPQILDDAERVIEFRSDLRSRINVISELCNRELGVKINYFIMFPLVVFSDELISVFFAENNVNWPKMQKEIFNIQNGGEKFYELLEQILDQPTYPREVYQLNYLILQYGFKGQLMDNDIKKTRTYYTGKLEEILKNFASPENGNGDKLKIHADRISFWELFKENFVKFYFFPLLIILCIVYCAAIWVLNLVLR